MKKSDKENLQLKAESQEKNGWFMMEPMNITNQVQDFTGLS